MSTSLKKLRESVNLSQWEVAKKLGYSTPQFVSNWERGIATPPAATLKKMATILRTDYPKLVAEFRAEAHRKLDKLLDRRLGLK